MFTISRLYNITLFKVNNFDLNSVRYTPYPPPRRKVLGVTSLRLKIFSDFFWFSDFSVLVFCKDKIIEKLRLCVCINIQIDF